MGQRLQAMETSRAIRDTPSRARPKGKMMGYCWKSKSAAHFLSPVIPSSKCMAMLCTSMDKSTGDISRRGKPFKWNKVESTADDTIPHRDIEETKAAEPLPSSLSSLSSSSSPSSPSSPPVSPRPSRDQCPFCFFEGRLPPVDRDRYHTRIDSLRRHVLRVHL
jgi:hypothetical protein